MAPSKAPLVRGEIVFGKDTRSFSDATARVRLEEVSYADAPAKIIAEQVISNVSYEPGSENKPTFSLYGIIPDEEGRYTVRVHVDLHRQGQITRGDYVSVESYPVLIQGQPTQLSVHVREVK